MTFHTQVSSLWKVIKLFHGLSISKQSILMEERKWQGERRVNTARWRLLLRHATCSLHTPNAGQTQSRENLEQTSVFHETIVSNSEAESFQIPVFQPKVRAWTSAPIPVCSFAPDGPPLCLSVCLSLSFSLPPSLNTPHPALLQDTSPAFSSQV